MAAGDFTASSLSDIQLKQAQMFKEGRHLRELTYPAHALKAFLERQRVAWHPILKGEKCIAVEASWLKDCAADGTTDGEDVTCDIAGLQIESDNEQYKPTFSLREIFAVTDDECRDMFAFQEKVAYSMLVKKTKLIKRFTTAFAAFIAAGATASVFVPEGMTNNAGTLEFAPIDANPSFLAKIALAAEMNRFENYYLLSGITFWESKYNAQFEKLNDDQRDREAKFNAFDMFWDPLNFQRLSIPNKMFMIEAGSAGFFPQNDYMSLSPTELTSENWTWREKIDLKYADDARLQDVYIDVRMTRECIVQEKDHRNTPKAGWHFELLLSGGLILGPTDCTGGQGIIELEQVEP